MRIDRGGDALGRIGWRGGNAGLLDAGSHNDIQRVATRDGWISARNQSLWPAGASGAGVVMPQAYWA